MAERKGKVQKVASRKINSLYPTLIVGGGGVAVTCRGLGSGVFTVEIFRSN